MEPADFHFTPEELAACGYQWFDAEGRLWSGAAIADLMSKPGGCGPFYRLNRISLDRLREAAEAASA